MANTSKESPKTKPKKESSEEAFSLEDISDLLEVLKVNEVTEFKLERSNERISLKRGPRETQVIQTAAPVAQQIQSAPAIQSVAQAAPVQAAEQAVESAAPASATLAPVPDSNVEEISSPMVGTFYGRPSPDADAYVSVGDTVKKGDKLCIIEAMKIMNEIEAEKSGKIVSICLDDGQMVEYGEALFKVEPL